MGDHGGDPKSLIVTANIMIVVPGDGHILEWDDVYEDDYMMDTIEELTGVTKDQFIVDLDDDD